MFDFPPRGKFFTSSNFFASIDVMGTESRFGAGRKFGTAVATHYGEFSEMLAFQRKRGRKTVQMVKNYGRSKILRIRVP